MYGRTWSWAGQFRTSNKNIGVDKLMIGVELRKLFDDCSFWITNKVFLPEEIADSNQNPLLVFFCVICVRSCFCLSSYKYFNVIALTALGSAGYAVGVLTWVFNRRRHHVIMRASVLVSILSYTSGMIALAVDVRRPWNMIWIMNPAAWNRYSVLLEAAVCMTAYVLLGLQMENLPAFVERFIEGDYPPLWKKLAAKAFAVVKSFYPFLIALAFILPSIR